MTNDELREKIAQAKGWRIGSLSTRTPPTPGLECYLDDNGKSYPLYQWATDIAAAWELVEEMYAIGFTVNIQRDYTGNTVYLTERGTDLYKMHIVEHADIAATAICESYLKLLAWKAAQG